MEETIQAAFSDSNFSIRGVEDRKLGGEEERRWGNPGPTPTAARNDFIKGKRWKCQEISEAPAARRAETPRCRVRENLIAPKHAHHPCN
jgi:hypothetical protein